MLGRRGPAQAAFTSSELRELGHMDGVDMRVDPEDAELDPLSQEWLDERGHLHRAQERRAAARVRRAAGRADARAADRAALPALAGRDPRRRTGRGDRRPPQRDRARRRRRAAAAARRTRTSRRSSAASSCARSATARCRCPTCRSTSAATCFRTTAAGCGRPTATPLPGVYAVGWIKRGPTGILGTNKRDAEETVDLLAEDLASGALPPRG